MKKDFATRLVAIVGGSGAGKSWLALRLLREFGPEVSLISQDDFYVDRSHLAPARREGLNFDHPRAIDWALLEKVLRKCRAGRNTRLPKYNFASHTRAPIEEPWTPRPVVLVEGLWLLRRPSLRKLFDLRIFLACPSQLRLERRLTRDVSERGRTENSVREQFWKSVAPMHKEFVAPQVRWADIVLQQPPGETELAGLFQSIRALSGDGAGTGVGRGQGEGQNQNAQNTRELVRMAANGTESPAGSQSSSASSGSRPSTARGIPVLASPELQPLGQSPIS